MYRLGQPVHRLGRTRSRRASGPDLDEPGLFEQAGQTWTNQTTSTVMLAGVVGQGRSQCRCWMCVARGWFELQLPAAVGALAAAPVAAGSTKPTSTASIVAVENRPRVVAHISEPIDHYLLSDAVNLKRLVEDELVHGMRRAIEPEVLSGDGIGEHFTGVLAMSGIVAQTFATAAPTSVRKALTALDISGYTHGVIVLSTAEWESVELLTATSGWDRRPRRAIDPVARRLWGVPVVLNQGLGAKTGLIIAEDALKSSNPQLG